ncbi:MAG TPA: SDR family oxidoreductase [Ktedonobacterales bacterium]|nr:SDR family oxidoreductase [Ktedonobacterales bacterium]
MTASPQQRTRQTQQPQQTALITGASSGIGAAMARVFASEGYGLALVARTESALNALADELRATYGVPVTVVPRDLAQPAAAQAIFETLQQANVTVDALVNNAGFASYGPFAQADLRNELNEMQVNMVALTALTRLFLPGMVERGRGGVLNVASTAAFQPGPGMAVYFASKAFVLSFSEALAYEVRGAGVHVTALCPGGTQSAFFDRAQMQNSRYVRSHLMDAATVARAGYEGLRRGRPVVIPGKRNRLLALGARLFPRPVVTRVSARLTTPVTA